MADLYDYQNSDYNFQKDQLMLCSLAHDLLLVLVLVLVIAAPRARACDGAPDKFS